MNPFQTMNAGYVQAMYEQYLRDPRSVDDEWRALFENGARGLPPLTLVEAASVGLAAPSAVEAEPERRAPAEAEAGPGDALAVALAMSVVKAFRTHGHLGARLDPLGREPVGDPAYDPATIGLTEEMMRRVPASVLRIGVPGATFADALPYLRATYCGTIAYEKEHIGSHEERVWLRQAIETGAHLAPLTPAEQRRLLTRLTQVETLERFLGKAYLGQKRFSIEGVDMLVPMLDLVMDLAARGRRARGRARDGAPRAPERARAHRRHAVRIGDRGVRGRAGRRGRRGVRRREVPPRRAGHLHDDVGRGADGEAVAEPESPRVGEPGGRGAGALAPDRPQRLRRRGTIRRWRCRS